MLGVFVNYGAGWVDGRSWIALPDGSTYEFLFKTVKNSPNVKRLGIGLDRILLRKMSGPEYYIIGSDSGAMTFESSLFVILIYYISVRMIQQ